jgi:SAM-dependent methyltransferase
VNNYDYCAAFVAARLPTPSCRVLDYGCGAGAMVTALRNRGVEAFGCDVFYEGGDYSVNVPPELLGTVIRRMDGNRIPFENESFDWVVNNQVLEHVPELETAIDEIRRVLKPDGRVLSAFPDRGVWREGHCGIPFLHYFPSDSRLRVWYAAALRSLGFGYHTEGQGALQWSENFCQWIDKWTYYRPYHVISDTFLQRFGQIEHLEDDWLRARLGRYAGSVALLPKAVQRWMVRKMVGLVFVSSGSARGIERQSSR